MAGTFSQIYIQAVFAVKGRENLLQKAWRVEVFKYMAGIIKEKGHKPIIVNGVSDHVHLFIGLKPAMAISDIIRDVKNNATNLINRKGWISGKFAWQEGYGAFSYEYIANQEAHHQQRSFRKEYADFLEKFEIPFEERFLFDWIEATPPEEQ